MGGNQAMRDVEAPEPVTAEEVAAALEQSRRLRQEAEVKVEEAEKTVGEMSRVLRRIAAAMERNPRSWDELFDGRTR